MDAPATALFWLEVTRSQLHVASAEGAPSASPRVQFTVKNAALQQLS